MHTVSKFFNIPFQLMCKDEGDKANGLLLLPNDMTWSELEKGLNHSWHDLTSVLKTLVRGLAGVWTQSLPHSR